jgi:DNA-binding response OmpR family regulator/cytoskeletal protein RodZ
LATIQVIDDDIVLLARLAAHLEQEGYEVLKASTIKPAEAMFAEHRPDLVLLEVKTNRGAGWELLEQFAGSVPVIILSGEGREDDIVRGLEAGAVDYITKPYRMKELLVRLRLRMSPGTGQRGASNGLPASYHTTAASKPATEGNPADSSPTIQPFAEPQQQEQRQQPQTAQPSYPSYPSEGERGGPAEPPAQDSQPHGADDWPAAANPQPVRPSSAQTSDWHVSANQSPTSSADASGQPAPGIAAPDRDKGAQQATDFAAEKRSVFISEIDEISLLRSYAEASPIEVEDDTLPADASLGRRLYMARRKKNVSLVQVENDLHIRMSYLQAMEEEKFSLLPRGSMAKQMVRSYAKYLELDADSVGHHYEQLYATQTDEIPYTSEARKSFSRIDIGPPPRWVLWAIAILLALVVSGAGIYWADPGGVRALGQHVLAVFVSPTPTVEPQITTTPQNKPQILPATLSPVVRETSDANEETTALTTTRSISQTGTAAALGETPSLSVTTTTESTPQTDDVPTQRPSRTATTLSEEPAPSTTLPQNPTDTPLAQPTEPADDTEPLIVPSATPVDEQPAPEQPAPEQPAPEQPVATDTVEPDTNTIVETLPTNTPEAIVMDTPLPAPTDTPLPAPTDTPLPAPTDTPLPAPTDTPAPLPTDTPEPDTEAPVPPTATPPALIDSDAFSMESIR